MFFESPDALWQWWRNKAAGIIHENDYFRLLCAWYRQGTHAERAVMSQWANPHPLTQGARNPHSDLETAWPCSHPTNLSSDWPRAVRDIELVCVHPDERCRFRFARFIPGEEQRAVTAALAARTPAARSQSRRPIRL